MLWTYTGIISTSSWCCADFRGLCLRFFGFISGRSLWPWLSVSILKAFLSAFWYCYMFPELGSSCTHLQKLLANIRYTDKDTSNTYRTIWLHKTTADQSGISVAECSFIWRTSKSWKFKYILSWWTPEIIFLLLTVLF